mgnify:CR=1 FL=1
MTRVPAVGVDRRPLRKFLNLPRHLRPPPETCVCVLFLCRVYKSRSRDFPRSPAKSLAGSMGNLAVEASPAKAPATAN